MKDKQYYTAAKYQDDEHAIRAAYMNANEKDQAEMEALLSHHNEQGGLDYRAILTGGMLAGDSGPVVTGVAVGAPQGYGATQQQPQQQGATEPATAQPIQQSAAPPTELPQQRGGDRSDGGCLPNCRPSRDSANQV